MNNRFEAGGAAAPPAWRGFRGSQADFRSKFDHNRAINGDFGKEVNGKEVKYVKYHLEIENKCLLGYS